MNRIAFKTDMLRNFTCIAAVFEIFVLVKLDKKISEGLINGTQIQTSNDMRSVSKNRSKKMLAKRSFVQTSE